MNAKIPSDESAEQQPSADMTNPTSEKLAHPNSKNMQTGPGRQLNIERITAGRDAIIGPTIIMPAATNPPIFTNIWFSPKRYSFFNFWRNTNPGTLIIDEDKATYSRENDQFVVVNIKSVSHTKMGGDINNNWVKVEYEDQGVTVTVFFAQAKRLGVGNFIGGSDELFQALRDLMLRTRY